MSDNSPTTTDSHKSSSTPSSAPTSPASSSASSSTGKDAPPLKASTPSAKPSKSDKSDSDTHKREGSGSSFSLKASLEKVKSATSSSNANSDAPAPSSTAASSSNKDWTSVLTFGLASSKGKGDISEWLPDLSDKLPASLFTVPPPQADGKPAQPALPADAVTPEFPNFTSLLPPPPPPSSALRFGWIDEYGDYHPASVVATAAKLNVKLQKAREQAKELIASVMAAQERLEKDKEPHSPRMSAIVKDRLSLEGEKRDSRGQGVERLVQVIEGSKGEKKVVVTEEEKEPEDL